LRSALAGLSMCSTGMSYPRRRGATLRDRCEWRRDRRRYGEVNHGAQRERNGADPVDALEQALDAAKA
jgi:hypothetical protein